MIVTILIEIFGKSQGLISNTYLRCQQVGVCMIILVLCQFIQIPLLYDSVDNKIRLNGMNIGNLAKFSLKSVCVNENIDKGRSYSSGDIDISMCSFSRISQYSGNGGVLYVANPKTMVIQLTMFYLCSCSISGGAIFFSSTSSVMRMICANMCSAGSQAHFALITASQDNVIEFLSMSKCSFTNSRYYPVILSNGNQQFDKANSSFNYVVHTSGVKADSPLTFSSIYSTFSNNQVSDSRCIFIYGGSGLISFSNIVGNNSPNNFGVVLIQGGDTDILKMLNCIFIENQGILFWVIKGIIEVSHCYISHNGYSLFNTKVNTENNNSYTQLSTYQMNFFSSYFCKTELPKPTQTPESSFKETPNETPKLKNSLNAFNRNQLIDFLAIYIVFVSLINH